MLITPEQYRQVRAAIDVSLTSAELSDEALRTSPLLSAADATIKARDPLWATRTGADLARLTEAAIFLTGAYLAPTIPALIAERYPEGYSYERTGVDYAVRAAELRALSDAALAAYLTPTEPTAVMPTIFAVASGRRGR